MWRAAYPTICVISRPQCCFCSSDVTVCALSQYSSDLPWAPNLLCRCSAIPSVHGATRCIYSTIVGPRPPASFHVGRGVGSAAVRSRRSGEPKTGGSPPRGRGRPVPTTRVSGHARRGVGNAHRRVGCGQPHTGCRYCWRGGAQRLQFLALELSCRLIHTPTTVGDVGNAPHDWVDAL
jgi:hypothetical protein